MLFVHDFPHELNEEKEIIKFNSFESDDNYFKRLIWRKDPDHKYKLKHGIAKCTKNIRERRFKAKQKYNHPEILEVAKKLKSIIDNGAANFENQMKNLQETQDDESITLKMLDNQSAVHSEINIQNKNTKQNNNIVPKNTKTLSLAPNRGSNKTNNININLNNEKEKFDSPNNINLKKNQIRKNTFASPANRKNNNSNNNTNNFSISLNLNENKIKTTFKNETIILPLNEKNPFLNKKNDENNSNDSDEDDKDMEIDPELKILKDEYYILKEEYNVIKKYLEGNTNENQEYKEKDKLKKKLKKRIKQIKEIFKNKTKLNKK